MCLKKKHPGSVRHSYILFHAMAAYAAYKTSGGQATRPHRTRRRYHTTVCLHKALDARAKEVLETPDQVTLECLTLLRKPTCSLESLQPLFVGLDSVQGSPQPIITKVGHLEVEESEPLARCAHIMDAASRRVLPGHLLRRCRILSSLQLGPLCQQRVSLTACTGEETTFLWRLSHQPLSQHELLSGAEEEQQQTEPGVEELPEASPQHQVQLQDESEIGLSHQSQPGAGDSLQGSIGGGISSESGGSSSHDNKSTILDSSSRTSRGKGGSQGSSGALSPSRKHSGDQAAGNHSGSESSGEAPDPPPRRVRAAWRVVSISRDDSSDDVAAAARPHPRLSPELVIKAQLAALREGNVMAAARYNMWHRSLMGNWETQFAHFRSLLRTHPYHMLLTHNGATLGAAATPTQRRFVQLVELELPGHATPQASFVWQLNMQADGCWRVVAISPVPDAAE